MSYIVFRLCKYKYKIRIYEYFYLKITLNFTRIKIVCTTMI